MKRGVDFRLFQYLCAMRGSTVDSFAYVSPGGFADELGECDERGLFFKSSSCVWENQSLWKDVKRRVRFVSADVVERLGTPFVRETPEL